MLLTHIVVGIGATTTIELLDALRARVAEQKVSDPAAVRDILRDEMVTRLKTSGAGKEFSDDRNTAILIVGVNGAGKTTTIAKLAHTAKSNGQKVILAAADTFRAGAIQQIQVWGERVGVDVIAHRAGGDPGAVVFDAMQAAKARNANLVIIDTAGRLHTQTNLMEELKRSAASLNVRPVILTSACFSSSTERPARTDSYRRARSWKRSPATGSC